MSIKKLSEVVKVLKKEGKASPNKIATEVGSDRRTIQEVLKVSSDLGITQCKTLVLSGRNFRACGLTPEFKKILEKLEKKDKTSP